MDVDIPFEELCEDNRTESVISNLGDIESYPTCIDMKQVMVEFCFGKIKVVNPFVICNFMDDT